VVAVAAVSRGLAVDDLDVARARTNASSYRRLT
jgi:hypothetical protein